MIQAENRLHARESVSGHDRSLIGLLKELRDETMTLLRQEVDLAKTETSEKMSRVGRNVGYLAVGGVILGAGFLVLLMAGVVGLYVGLVAAGLSHATSGWLAPLIVGAVVAIIGYSFLQKAISTLRRETIVPERTRASLVADKEWIQEKVH
jgi:cation transport ATPase